MKAESPCPTFKKSTLKACGLPNTKTSCHAKTFSKNKSPKNSSSAPVRYKWEQIFEDSGKDEVDN